MTVKRRATLYIVETKLFNYLLIAAINYGYAVAKKYYIAVFVMESQETDADNAAIIASISKIVYDTLNSDIQ